MALELRPLTGALGAEARGADFAAPAAADVQALREALHEHHVLVLREQKLTREAQLALARNFGAPEQHPIVEGMQAHPEIIRVHKPAGAQASFGVGWHSDNSFQPRPSAVTVLYGETIPPHGGDTLFSNMARAYAALSPQVQSALAKLQAVHSAGRAYAKDEVGAHKYAEGAPIKYRESESLAREVTHPVVRRHPHSGRLALYVNPMFTQRVCGLHAAESGALLRFLYAHAQRPEFQCRVRWAPGTLVLWDNRSVWHYAMDDYREYERIMFRVTLAGETPRP